MPSPKFTAQISLGNVLQILLILVGGISFSFALQAATDQNARDIEQIRAERAELRATLNELDTRVREAERNAVRIEERLQGIHGLLMRIDNRLARIEDGRGVSFGTPQE